MKDERLELTAEEVAAIARDEREASSDEMMLLSLVLREYAEGAPEYTPDEVREEIIIPVDGVGAYATDETDTSTESSASGASTPKEPPTDDSQITPEQVAEDDRIDLSVAAIQAFTDGELTLSTEQEADLQSVVRDLSD
ncbi:hypothetical protein EXE53_32280, partial [Halorubrum sp. SD626R]|uniref:hypothetical protein n=1 Tax=Halorubrum sp. SD626R TaxID=1419722 RepID=UPI00113500EC